MVQSDVKPCKNKRSTCFRFISIFFQWFNGGLMNRLNFNDVFLSLLWEDSFAREKHPCIYRSECTKTTSQEQKTNDIQAQQTQCCRHTIEPQNYGLVMSHARPSKDDFVSSGKGGRHLWFLFNPLRTKRLRFCFFAVGQILSGWKMDWCWMHVQLDGVVVMVSANLDTLGQNLFQPTHQCRWWCDWYCSQVTQGHQAGPSWTGELTDDSQGVIRDLTGELTTGELTDDGHVFWVSVVHFWEESLIICARRSW